MRTIFAILGFVAAIGVFMLYTRPAYDDVQVLQREIEQYDLALDKAAELQELKSALLEKRKAFDPEDLERLEKMLPNHVENVRLILDLDRLAASFGVALQNVIVSKPASESAGGETVIGASLSGDQKYDSLTLKFSTRGTYSSFVSFIEELERSLRIVDVISLTIAADSSSTGLRSSENSYRYEIAIRTYWLR